MKKIKDEKNLTGSEDRKRILWSNEEGANHFMFRMMLIILAMIFLNLLLILVGAVELEASTAVACVGIEVAILGASCLLCIIENFRAKYIKYVMVYSITVSSAISYYFMGYTTVLLMVVPVILSLRYYNRRVTAAVSAVTVVLYGAAEYLSALSGNRINSNFLGLTDGMTLEIHGTIPESVLASGFDLVRYAHHIMEWYFLPKCILFLIIASICIEIAEKGFGMMVRQNEIARAHVRIDAELDLARQIQYHAMPVVSGTENSSVFDIAAEMKAAKETGGDFYDILRLDDTHLALLIADVSGKGVPAAMYMMVSKLLLDDCIIDRKSPSEVLTEVNSLLWDKAEGDMFVTVWLGILDLSSGELTTANAGHEYPIIRRNGGMFEVYKDCHGLVLGGMEGIRYKEETIHLNPGDSVFVYTDGVTEAHNGGNRLFGIDRAVKCLNESPDESMAEHIKRMQSEIRQFAGDAPQFDDITMLGLTLNQYAFIDGISLIPDLNSMVRMQEYMDRKMEEAEVPMKTAARMNVAMDEIYSNVVHYSHASGAFISCRKEDGFLVVSVSDDGIPYNPLEQPEPDTTLPVEEREQGGLGIYITKKLMDEVSYTYENSRNILVMKHKL